ncbi:MAG: CRTAC1 family protein [Gemmatimonadota bacterium]|jgi:hypothetical protein
MSGIDLARTLPSAALVGSLALVTATGCTSGSAARFEPVQPELFAAGGALTNAWADYDGDGDADLFVGFNGGGNRLYRNDGGTFAEVAAGAGVADTRPTRAAAWTDADGDGDADLIIGFTPADGPVLKLYANDGGRFTDIAADRGLSADSGTVRQISGVDVDGDGDIDVFVAFRDRANALFRNDGGVFREVAAELGLDDTRHTVGAVWFDADDDGDLDLYAANMDGDANGFFRNDDGHFTDVADAMGLAWGGRTPDDPDNGTVRPCAADVDNDGRLDLFTANYGPNGLFLNRSTGFDDVSAERGVAIDSRYDTCAFADYDGDGLLDVYVNGTVTGGTSYADHLYRNTGARFEEATPAELAAFDGDHGAQWADFDGDGDLDLALAAAGADRPHPLLRNTGPHADGSASLLVMALDSAGRPVLAGATVRVLEAGTGRVIATRLIDSGSGYNSQNLLPVHFGLAGAGSVDVEVVRPLGGERVAARLEGIDPAGLESRVLTLRVARSGAVERVR